LDAKDLVAAGGPTSITAVSRHQDASGQVVHEVIPLTHIRGVAPECTIVSVKVLDQAGRGQVSNLITALEDIDRINGYGKDLRIHGVNLSVGYDFDPEWFACGQSPLCNVVDRVVRSGVIVVVAAGNTGYGYQDTVARGSVAAGLTLSINDPGNADRAITVGSTHRDMPHVYGVSYFSSKGPTGDGRPKPDLVAPGEKIVSCGAGSTLAGARAASSSEALYVDDSGTSMAAPHVSGAIAAFLSIRREFIGQAEDVKRIFLESATDLHRERYFQGAGLVDVMRAIQSV
jgi:subtilisin family serine protease